MAKRKKKHTGRIIVSVALVMIAAGLFIGRNAITDSIRTKATEVVAKKILEEQLTKAVEETLGSNADLDVSEIVNNMDSEDIAKATEIAEKYVEPDKISEYVEMVKGGNISQLKQQVKEEITEADQQQLQELYEKYKDQIPLDQITSGSN